MMKKFNYFLSIMAMIVAFAFSSVTLATESISSFDEYTFLNTAKIIGLDDDGALELRSIVYKGKSIDGSDIFYD